MVKESFVYIRNKINHFLYITIIRKIFFIIDPEKIHYQIVSFGRFLEDYHITKKLTKLFFYYSNKKLEQEILGIKFPNPVGLAAGFDKNAYITEILPYVGFGFVEVGSITGEPCKGNPKPRLWRLKKSKGLVVNYGLNNDGCEKISKRLKNKSFKIPVGISIAKTNSKKTVSLNEGVKDYIKAYKKFTDIGSYYTINLSCPNAFGGQPYNDPKRLNKLLTEIDKIKTKKPIFLKISPDLKENDLDKIIKISNKHNISGFVCSNLTKDRNNKKIVDKEAYNKGGISGTFMAELSNKQIKYIYNKTKGRHIIIGCGGVYSANDVYKKIRLGASLVQILTCLIYGGPQLTSEINQELVNLLKKDGFNNISEAIGMDNKNV